MANKFPHIKPFSAHAAVGEMKLRERATGAGAVWVNESASGAQKQIHKTHVRPMNEVFTGGRIEDVSAATPPPILMPKASLNSTGFIQLSKFKFPPQLELEEYKFKFPPQLELEEYHQSRSRSSLKEMAR
jgi:hypothetical protein